MRLTEPVNGLLDLTHIGNARRIVQLVSNATIALGVGIITAERTANLFMVPSPVADSRDGQHIHSLSARVDQSPASRADGAAGRVHIVDQ